jgi:glucose/arabinose dehydrogenase
MRRISRAAAVVAMGASVTLGVVVPAAPAVAKSSQPTVHVAASGLNSPKHLTWGPGGVYVVESGTGGSNCVSGPSTEGPGITQYCVGTTAAVDVITRHGVRSVLTGLPSVVDQSSMTASGPSAVTFYRGALAVLYQDLLVGPDGATALPAPFANVAGRGLLALPKRSHDTWIPVVDFARFAATHPQDPATLGGLGETVYDSDPYDVTPYKDGFAVVDAAANSLLYVDPRHGVRLLARFPTEPQTVPAGVLGPVAMTIQAQAVPTSVAVGPDGALYVGTLRGVPSLPGGSQIYRIDSHGTVSVYASGLTAVTAIAFDKHGRLLATELSTGGLLAPPAVPGALVRIDTHHTVTTLPVDGLFAPTGVAVAPNGDVYVSNYGRSAGTATPSGQVLRITGLG